MAHVGEGLAPGAGGAVADWGGGLSRSDGPSWKKSDSGSKVYSDKDGLGGRR